MSAVNVVSSNDDANQTDVTIGRQVLGRPQGRPSLSVYFSYRRSLRPTCQPSTKLGAVQCGLVGTL